MKFLNEDIARRANQEDDCTGHFWESRFKSQALLDDKAVLSAMAYVDLNPIRAAMAVTPEESDFTSIKERIEYWRQQTGNTENDSETAQSENDFQPETLMKFAGNYRESIPVGLPFNLLDYLQLVDWTGRAIRDDKRGAIHEGTPLILGRLEISPAHWIDLSTNFESRFKGLVGSIETVKQVIQNFGLIRCPNYRNSKLLFG